MKPADVIKFFGTQQAAAAALGFGQSSIANWVARDKVPPISQLKLEIISEGKLKADKHILSVPKQRARKTVSRA